MKEITVEAHLVDEFKRHFLDAQIHKYEIRRGEPDRILLLPKGVCIFVETKRPGEDLRKAQVRAFKRLRLLGFECFMCDTKGKVDLLINYIGMKFYATDNVLF